MPISAQPARRCLLVQGCVRGAAHLPAARSATVFAPDRRQQPPAHRRRCRSSSRHATTCKQRSLPDATRSGWTSPFLQTLHATLSQAPRLLHVALCTEAGNRDARISSTLVCTGLPGAVLPGSLCAALFPAVIGSRFPGAVYISQTLKFRRPALVSGAVCYGAGLRAATAVFNSSRQT